MLSRDSLLDRFIALIANWPAAILVTVVTLATVATLIVVTTPIGCGLGYKGAQCTPRFAAATPSSQPAQPSPTSTEPFVPPASPTYPQPQPTDEPASAPNPNPPYPPVPSQSYPYPTPAQNVHDPSMPGYAYASGAYPPLYPMSSGGPQAVGLTCRLPIYAGGPGSGGFLVLPDGSFIADPRSGVAIPSPSPGTPSPTPQLGYGPQNWFGLSYDAKADKWL